MDCVMNGGAFLRSNGDLVCWDDAGCNKILQSFDPDIDYGTDVFLGEVYDRIRNKLKSDVMPHPSICGACLALNPTQNFSSAPKEQRRIHYLQIESSFACQLRCTNCYPGVDRKGVLQRRSGGHLNLKMSAFSKILDDFHRSRISIDVVEFQGHGEPLINKSVWDMIRMTRALFPLTHIRVITNANFEFSEEMVAAGVSEMVFSIDGVDQESYDPYRVSGDFDQAYRFTCDFSSAARRHRLPIRTSWKYILFEHNSSEAQLDRLRHLAEAASVNDVHLVLTQMGPSSRRFFKALLDLRDRADEDPAAFQVLQAMQAPTSASWLSAEFERHIGRSPFPHGIAGSQSGRGTDPEDVPALAGRKIHLRDVAGAETQVNYRVSCYLSIQENLDENLNAARENLAARRHADAGRSLVALATKLWRLYEGRYDMLTKSHNALIRQLLEIVGDVSEEYRREVFLKLECFQISYVSDLDCPIRLFASPINDIERDDACEGYVSTGDDPCFILFSEQLSIPHGNLILHYKAEMISGSLARSKLYYDTGSGFCEQNSIVLDSGPLRECRALVSLPPGTRRIRLDPADAPGRFLLKDIRLEKLSRVAAARQPLSVAVADEVQRRCRSIT